MNSNVYVMTFIFLSLENVGRNYCSIHNPGDYGIEGSQNFTCFAPNLYYQCYNTSKVIGIPQTALDNILSQTAVKTTRFIIKVKELDDDNIERFCENSNHDTSKEKTSPSRIESIYNYFKSYFQNYFSEKHINNESSMTLIKIEANETCKENEEPLKILNYNEKQNVSFSCLEHINKITYIQLGLINTTSNIIKTSVANSTHKIYDLKDNGTILWCVYYTVVNKTEKETWITRYVTNKTLLLYYSAGQVAPGDKENRSVSTGINSAADADPRNQTIIIIVTIAVAVVFILLLIIVIYRKRCRKKPEPETKVLYADLDILRQIEPDSFPRPSPEGPEEESPYAQIIGEMRPQTK